MVNLGALIFLSVVWSIHPGGAVVLLFWDVVFEFLEGMCNVPIHADAYGVFVVVPFEVHTVVLFGFPINFERVFGMDTSNEMINVLFVCIFGTEENVPCVMEKKTFSAWHLVVVKFF